MLTEARNRYPGAHPFPDDPLWRRLFYGREQESTKLANQILANRLVVVFARSGIGKSSILNAGIAENLRAKGYIPLNVRVADPKLGSLDTIYDSIAAECERQRVEHVVGSKTGLWQFFKTSEFWREDFLLTPILVLDQFEELFTLQSESARNAFINQLSYLARGVPPTAEYHDKNGILDARINNSSAAVKIVVSLREEFLAELDEISDRIPGILDERFRLLPLTRSAASRALAEAARIQDKNFLVSPFELDADAENAVLNFLESAAPSAKISSRTIEPFQLQLVCQYLEKVAGEKQQKSSLGETKLVLSDVGGEIQLRRILKRFYKSQVSAIPLRQRRRVRRLCSEYLINSQGRRLRLEESEIKRLLKLNVDTLSTLVQGRLLRSDTLADQTYYELSHDSLIKPIIDSSKTILIVQLLLALVIGITCVLFAVDLFFAPLVLGYSSDFLVAKEQLREFRRDVELHLLRSFAIIGGMVLFIYAISNLRIIREKWRRLRM